MNDMVSMTTHNLPQHTFFIYLQTNKRQQCIRTKLLATVLFVTIRVSTLCLHLRQNNYLIFLLDNRFTVISADVGHDNVRYKDSP